MRDVTQCDLISSVRNKQQQARHPHIGSVLSSGPPLELKLSITVPCQLSDRVASEHFGRVGAGTAKTVAPRCLPAGIRTSGQTECRLCHCIWSLSCSCYIVRTARFDVAIRRGSSHLGFRCRLWSVCFSRNGYALTACDSAHPMVADRLVSGGFGKCGVNARARSTSTALSD